ncbi:MAG: ATP-binding protein [Sulfuricurvum sp. GWF2_44_89]|uniref:Iron-sulfur cluster carrier protein n=1 Tax=Sulfuricurvum kujiense TaxID=148813 RepID=A0A2D3W826_9BACT|nr:MULTISPECIES: Mrp/NBP35 family ATP-binding protein [Sulfuricurvum]OHD77689.1 MAG: ATP-binding protein [Sulfuricurvum sp. GWF2_44_89]OHD90559.1 MAG: ATP-binding protein [Sulfuricurvum sp. RIFOXYD12_FULL_44_77]OHD91844.1 MAG: ATP-binding protein [Sulfuricurvum sp. RIFOXYD2_FULL_44_160]DAB37502.1 MAG TPA: ATP-binding protein [Sulfuricurvum kujiense]
MNTKELQEALNTLSYPGLSRTLGDLKLISEVKVSEGAANIELLTVSDDSYLTVKSAIEAALGEQFSRLNITKKAQVQKDTNYGNSSNPNNRAPYAANVIAVTSGKGGVGKSTVSVNLAIALAQKGYRVGILDADVYGPNVPRLTNTDLEKIRWNDDKIIPSENYGIKIMSVALTTPTSDTPLVWRSSVAVSALIQFLEDVEWGELDFMVIDMPPGTGDIQLTMAQELPITAGVIVTTPQLVASDDVSRAIRMFQDIHVPMAGLVENMSYFIAPDTLKRYDIFGSGGGARLAERYNIPLLGQIPLNMEIREGSDNGEPPVVLGNDTLKSYYKEIVENMLKAVKFKI